MIANKQDGTEPNETDRKPFKFQFTPLLASVPASVAAALLGSRLGVQGTLIGAAVAALASGVVAQFATFGVERTHAGIKLVTTRRPDEQADADAPVAPASPVRPVVAAPRRHVHVGVVVAGVLVTAAATFAVALGLLTAAEVGTGRSVDGGYTSTVRGATQGKATTAPQPADPDASTLGKPKESASPSPEGTPQPSPAPSVPASPAPTPSAGSPDAAPTPKPSAPASSTQPTPGGTGA